MPFSLYFYLLLKTQIRYTMSQAGRNGYLQEVISVNDVMMLFLFFFSFSSINFSNGNVHFSFHFSCCWFWKLHQWHLHSIFQFIWLIAFFCFDIGMMIISIWFFFFFPTSVLVGLKEWHGALQRKCVCLIDSRVSRCDWDVFFPRICMFFFFFSRWCFWFLYELKKYPMNPDQNSLNSIDCNTETNKRFDSCFQGFFFFFFTHILLYCANRIILNSWCIIFQLIVLNYDWLMNLFFVSDFSIIYIIYIILFFLFLKQTQNPSSVLLSAQRNQLLLDATRLMTPMGSMKNLQLPKSAIHPIFRAYFAITGLSLRESSILRTLIHVFTVSVLLAVTVSNAAFYFVSQQGTIRGVEPYVYSVIFVWTYSYGMNDLFFCLELMI